jgi:hypothetical protein
MVCGGEDEILIIYMKKRKKCTRLHWRLINSTLASAA